MAIDARFVERISDELEVNDIRLIYRPGQIAAIVQAWLPEGANLEEALIIYGSSEILGGALQVGAVIGGLLYAFEFGTHQYTVQVIRVCDLTNSRLQIFTPRAGIDLGATLLLNAPDAYVRYEAEGQEDRVGLIARFYRLLLTAIRGGSKE